MATGTQAAMIKKEPHQGMLEGGTSSHNQLSFSPGAACGPQSFANSQRSSVV